MRILVYDMGINLDSFQSMEAHNLHSATPKPTLVSFCLPLSIRRYFYPTRWGILQSTVEGLSLVT